MAENVTFDQMIEETRGVLAKHNSQGTFDLVGYRVDALTYRWDYLIADEIEGYYLLTPLGFGRFSLTLYLGEIPQKTLILASANVPLNASGN